MYIFVPGEWVDPLWPRLAISILFGTSFLASYFSPLVRKYFPVLFGINLHFPVVWLAGLLYYNDFSAEYLSAYYIYLFATTLTFERRQPLFMYSGFNLLVMVTTALLYGKFTPELGSFFGLQVAVLLVVNLSRSFRIRDQEKMALAGERLKTIQEATFQSSPDGMITTDLKGNTIEYNNTFLDLWGMPAEYLQEQDSHRGIAFALKQLSNPESFEAIYRQGMQNLSDDISGRLEFNDGRLVEVLTRPLVIEGKPIGRLWYFRDITAKVREEERLFEAEQIRRKQNELLIQLTRSKALNEGRLKEAFTEISEAAAGFMQVDSASVWLMNEQQDGLHCIQYYHRTNKAPIEGTDVLFANHPTYFAVMSARRMLSVDDVGKDPITAEFADGTYTDPVRSLIHAQIRVGGTLHGVFSIEQGSEPRQWTADENNFVGSLADLLGTALEANEKRRAKQELEKSIAVLRAVFGSSETGILVAGPDYNVIDFNDLYLKIWGISPAMIQAGDWESIVKHCKTQLKDVKSYEASVQNVMENPAADIEGIVEFADGRIVERYSKPLFVSGKLEGRVWFYLDVTERKRKEIELINRNFELDSFVYRASHDLKAPLNSIMGLIEIIQGESELDQVLNYIGLMDRSVKKLDDFIQQLTQFSQDARLKVATQAIQFRNLLDNTLQSLQYMEHADRIEMRIHIDQPTVFFSDPVRIGIVFNNLISNAIKYQDLNKPSPFLEIDIRTDSESATCVFKDNGVGIQSKYVEKVFELFFRASGQSYGSGLGLYITHNAVEKLGGTIAIESTPGAGTRFELQIPNRLPENEPLPEEAVAEKR